MSPRKTKALADMTDAEFERFLKRNGYVGIGAANMAIKRRLDIKARQEKEEACPTPAT